MDLAGKTSKSNILQKHKGIIVILLLAFSLRLMFCLLVYPSLISNKGDELGWTIEGALAVDPYDSIAKNIISGRGYRSDSDHVDYERLPLYVYFLVAVYKIWGSEAWKFQIIQALLDTISCLLIYLIALKLFQDRGVALLAALAYALYFKMIQVTSLPVTEVLYVLLLLIFLYVFHLSFQKHQLSILAGVLLGAMTLCKPITLVFPIVAGAAYLLRLKRKAFKIGVLFFSGFLVLITPLFVRNYLWEGKVFFSTGAGKMLYLGTAIDYTKSFRSEDLRLLKEIRSTYSYPYRPEVDSRLKKIALGRIAKDPWNYVKRLSHRLYMFWMYPDFSTQLMAVKTVLISLFNLTVILLAAWGMHLAKNRNAFIQPFLLIMLYSYAVYVLIYACSRYSLPLFPFLFIFSSYALMGFLRKIFHLGQAIENTHLPEDR